MPIKQTFTMSIENFFLRKKTYRLFELNKKEPQPMGMVSLQEALARKFQEKNKPGTGQPTSPTANTTAVPKAPSPPKTQFNPTGNIAKAPSPPKAQFNVSNSSQSAAAPPPPPPISSKPLLSSSNNSK
jgi:hypothetical protein